VKGISFLWLAPTLTKIGKRFGIDAHYFAKGSMLVLIGHAVSILRGIITGYLVARLFEKEIYGQYQFMLSIVGMLSLFGLAGLGNPVARAWARGESFSLRRITMVQLKVCLIGSAILLCCIPFLEHYHRQELWPFFLAAAVLFPLPPIAMVHFGGYTIGKARFDISLKATLVWSVIMTVATLGVILFSRSALLLLIIGMSVPSLVYVYYSRNIRALPMKGEDTTDAILSYGWKLTWATLPMDLVWYVDKLLISHFFGLAQLATFSVALLIPEQLKQLLKQFFPLSFAKQAAGNDTQERRRKLIKIVLTGTGIFAVGIATYILLTPFFIPWLFPQYDARELVILTSLAAASLVTIPGTLLTQYLEARGMVREIKFSNLSAAGVFLASLFILIPSYGVMGAVIARGVLRFTGMGFSLWFVMNAPIKQNTLK
jgi:O-antigen/teichoic acid export membrane protein